MKPTSTMALQIGANFLGLIIGVEDMGVTIARNYSRKVDSRTAGEQFKPADLGRLADQRGRASLPVEDIRSHGGDVRSACFGFVPLRRFREGRLRFGRELVVLFIGRLMGSASFRITTLLLESSLLKI
jgi:hypothetical protein